MEWLWFVLVLLISGLIVGALARLLVPGEQAMGVLGTALAGLAGSILGGFVARLLFGAELEWWVALLFSIGGAALIVAPFTIRARRTAVY